MADKKISELTAASTPLAGTEVLPIVQSGSTVKVSAANVTAGRAVSALSYTSTVATGTAPLVVASTTEVVNLRAANATSSDTANAVKSNATTGVLQVVGPAAASTRVMTTPDANFTVARTDAGQTFTGNNNVDGLLGVNTGPNTDGQIRIYNTTTRVLGAKYGVRFADSSFETNGSIYIEQAASGNNSAEMAFVANAGTGGIQITSGQEFLRGYGNGNAKIPAGNLVLGTSGKGIFDTNGNESLLFTATASAVNELTVANAATGNGPTISATGSDTNISVNLTAKGTGTVNTTNNGLFVGSAASAGGLVRTDGFSKVFTAATANIFTLRFYAQGAAFVDVAVGGIIAAVGGQRQVARYAINQVNGGTATVTNISSTGDGLISTSVADSGDYSTVTFIVAGNASNQATYQIMVSVMGISADGSGGYDTVVYTRS